MRSLLILLVLVAFQSVGQDITSVILIRHAEKEDTDDQNPGLSAQGLLRAQQLADLLSEIDLEAIYSTNYVRTLNTIDPISKSRDLNPIIYDPRDLEGVAAKVLQQHKGKTVLVSGHSNTTPSLVNILIGKEDYEQLDEDDYNWIFIVDVVAPGNGKVKPLIFKVK